MLLSYRRGMQLSHRLKLRDHQSSALFKSVYCTRRAISLDVPQNFSKLAALLCPCLFQGSIDGVAKSQIENALKKLKSGLKFSRRFSRRP